MSRPRRGAALLLVLASLVLVMSSSVMLLQLASTARLGRRINHDNRIANDLARAVQPALERWLAKESPDVVLPPDAQTPEVPVFRDVLAEGARPIEVRVTAWDQGGLIPFDAARGGSPLESDLPVEVKRAVESIKLGPSTAPGLDLFVGNDALMPAFPEGGATEGPPSVGAWVATHNSGWINVNTAPIDLVEAAMRLAGRGGLEQIVAARAQGELATMGDLPQSGDADDLAPDLVAQSRAWAFRIDVRVGLLRRSWWAVYESGGQKWECVQRLAIPE